MNKSLKKFLIINLNLIVLLSLSGLPVLAQDASQNGPSQAEIDVEKAKNAPSQEQIQEFEKEFGGPPESFPTPSIQKPTFEQPGTVSEEVKKYVSDKDLVSVYCAMTRWRSGDFFSAMDAVKKYVIEPSQQIKSDFGIDFEIPDIDALRAEGAKRTDGICNASTVAEAEQLAGDFYNWGQNQTQGKFDAMRVDMQAKLTEKGNALKDKITKEIQPFIDEQKAGIEDEMKALADQIVEKKKSEIQARLTGARSAPDVNALKAEITQAVTSGINSKVEEKKAQLKSIIQNKVNELVGSEKAKFEKIGENFKNVEQKIYDYIKDNRSQYDKYKTEAFALRKKLVLDILDKNLSEGLKKLDASEADLADANKNDPSVKTTGQLKAELQQDRKDLEAKLDAALEAGNETAFQQALNDFRAKWEAVKANGEKAMEQSVSKVCTIALAQFDKANTQMNPGIKQIETLHKKCANSVFEECLKTNEFSSRFESVVSKSADLKTEMALATQMCQNPQTSDRKNLIALMKKIQSDAEDFKIYGQALESEKAKVLVQTAEAICAQALPELNAAETEIKKNDLTVLQNNITRCQGKTSEECAVVNKLSGGVANLKADISSFTTNVQKVKTLCSKPLSEEDFKTLSDTLNSLKSEGQDLRAEAKDMQVQQAEKMSGKALCRAVVPQMEGAKQQISSGLTEMNKIKSDCSGKTDERCKVINANSAKFDALSGQVQKTLKIISDINAKCDTASVDSLDQGLIDLLDGMKNDKETIDKMIKDIKTLEAGAGKGAGITIEAENELSSNLLPRSESWHSSKGKSGESWRPPVFGTGYWYLSRGGESLTYNFSAPKDGTYNVWVRDYVDNFQARGVRRITINFDGKNFGTFGETSASVPSGNKIGVFAWHKVGAGVSLKAGQHSMKITKEATTAGAAILDSFYLTTGSEVPSEK